LARFVELCPPGGEGAVVLYTTSLRGIRKTFEDCNALRLALESLLVHIDERDVALHDGFRNELRELMQRPPLASLPASVPKLFINGRYIGGAEEVLQLHEEQKLAPLLDRMPRQRSASGPCDGCGGVRFIPCLDCSGSRKLVDPRSQDTIRCPECNENGLIQCPICN
jgi:glutaredoxin domain-containing cysteine-rich protein 1